ncbi:hypothetical protein [Streptomyces sp. NPDC013489]|uniref:hypothetical protein n=1 Tax=Streptomyces sp. NPDC013489 TaxID=3155606 RepID=UPI0033C770A0
MAAWTAQHRLSVYRQVETTAGPVTERGQVWADTRPTGRVHLLCNCGWSSGWIDHTDMPSREQLQVEHGVPLMSLSV